MQHVRLTLILVLLSSTAGLRLLSAAESAASTDPWRAVPWLDAQVVEGDYLYSPSLGWFYAPEWNTSGYFWAFSWNLGEQWIYALTDGWYYTPALGTYVLNLPGTEWFLNEGTGEWAIGLDSEASPFKGPLDAYLNNTLSDAAPGLSVTLLQGGKVVYRASKGLARRSPSHRIGPHTQFRTGSISKPITAIAIMQLVEDGLISLDTKIRSILPELPASYRQITIEHLLSHRSGLLDYIDDNINQQELHNLTNTDLLNALPTSAWPNLQFIPGTAGDYSNTGYAILASILEAVTSKRFPDYLHTRIFEPLGMTDTFVIDATQGLGDQGSDYALSYGTTALVFGYNSLIYGASGVASSTHDLSLLVKALLNGSILSSGTLQSMRELRGPVPGISDYGLGWMLGSGAYWHTGTYSDRNDFFHTGGYDGYRTVLSINPDLDLQVIILSNNGDVSGNQMFALLKLARDIARP